MVIVVRLADAKIDVIIEQACSLLSESTYLGEPKASSRFASGLRLASVTTSVTTSQSFWSHSFEPAFQYNIMPIYWSIAPSMYYCLRFVAILRRWPDTDLPQTSIRDTVDFLRMKDQFESVTVNSTLGKHLINSYDHLTIDPVLQSDYTLITRDNRGKALLIYSKQERPDWEYQYRHSKHVLEEQLYLEVNILCIGVTNRH